jgi:hypothetical protein
MTRDILHGLEYVAKPCSRKETVTFAPVAKDGQRDSKVDQLTISKAGHWTLHGWQKGFLLQAHKAK